MEQATQYSWQLHEFKSDNAELCHIWQQIIAKDSDSPIANSLLFMQPLLTHQLGGKPLYLAICYENEIPLTLLPFTLDKQTKYFCRWFDLGTPFHLHVNLFNLPNTSTHNKNNMFNQLIKDAKIWPIKWDRLVIRNLLTETGFNNSEFSGEMAWFDTSSGKIIHDVFSKKLYKNFIRLEKKLHREISNFKLEICTNEAMTDELNRYFNLECNSWINTQKIPVKGDKQLELFYQNLVENYAVDGRSRIYFYRNEDAIIAGALGFIMGSTLYIHKICYDQNYSKYAPGGILMSSIIQSVISNEKITTISLVTYPDWAKRWHPQRTELYNFVYYNTTFKGWLCKLTAPLLKNTRKKIKQLYLKFKGS